MAEECKQCRDQVYEGQKFCSDKCKRRAKDDKRWKRTGEWKRRLGKGQ